jgi:hypothetical protein
VQSGKIVGYKGGFPCARERAESRTSTPPLTSSHRRDFGREDFRNRTLPATRHPARCRT